MGGNINYRKNRFQAGISGLYHTYSRMYNPTMRNYNLYYLRDSSNVNASIDYSYQLPGFIFAGETAISKNGSVATLNSVQYRPSSNLSFSVLHRYYPISYNALYAQAFSEGSSVRNEQGLFLSARFTPFTRFTVNTYLDMVRFPWLKFGVDAPSKALDFYFLGTYTFSRASSWDIRYKYKQKRRTWTGPMKIQLPFCLMPRIKSGSGIRMHPKAAGNSARLPTWRITVKNTSRRIMAIWFHKTSVIGEKDLFPEIAIWLF